MEHRCGERISLRAPVRLRRAGWDTTGILTSASISGAFIRTRLQAPTLAMIELEIGDARIQAYVLRCEPTGIAVEWFELAPTGIAVLLTPLALEAARTPATTIPAVQPRAEISVSF